MSLSVLSLNDSRTRQPAMRVEQLEARWCPAGGGKVVAPRLSYSIVDTSDPGVEISGRVTGTYNAYSTVNFSGSVTQSLTTDSNGYFSFTANAENLGDMFAVGWDNHGTQTSVISNVLTSLPPAFTSFTASYVGNNLWSFSGNVENEGVENLTVSFSGLSSLAGKTATTNAAGDFILVVLLEPGESGTVEASVSDHWGLTGTAYTDVYPG